MTSASKRLRDLERRYNGPIPRAERDAVLHATPRTIRSAWERIRFYRRWTLQAIEASARWRAMAALGGYAHLTPLEMLARRAELACAMVHAAHQLLGSRTFLHQLEKGTPEARDRKS